MATTALPIPPHFDADAVDQVWRVQYQQRASDADTWRTKQVIAPAAADQQRITLLLVDVQNTFCIPEFELFVAGANGRGAVEDNLRLCRFIYRYLDRISEICPTMDTHQAAQIFHSIFLVDDQGHHPPPYTMVSAADVQTGKWRFNAHLAASLGITAEYGQAYLEHYTRRLQTGGKYELTIWPYHAMLGGIGHALVSSIEEAIFFHSVARAAQPDFQVKGSNPLTENYSVLRPEVLKDGQGAPISEKNKRLIAKLLSNDAVIIAGQAKSHCVAWTIADLLTEIETHDSALAEKVYLLEDCTSPVVIDGVVDYSDAASQAFERFARAGMHIVRTTEPLDNWPGPLGRNRTDQ